MSSRYAVLLAGGVGSRLAPLSSPQFPKQFFRLPGEDESLLQQAARAACGLVPAEQVITVTTTAFAPLVRQQLQAIAPELAWHILVEADGAGTAASCAVAAHYISRLAEKGMMWVLPCDHDRRPPLSLRYLREEAFAVAEEGHILTFGVLPTAPDCGFGYLIADNDGVERFCEKPDMLTAQALLASGRAWWNSGMFVLPVAKLLGYLHHLAPELNQACRDALHRGEWRDHMLWLCGESLAGMPPASLDTVVMERATGLKMRALNDGWHDIGTWPRLLSWWQNHAAHIPAWDFGNGETLAYAEAWQKNVSA